MSITDRPSAALTVGVTTRNRPESLGRCLASLALLGPMLREIIVVDDSSTVPVQATLKNLPADLLGKVRFIDQPGERGYIVARNAIVRLASSEYVLLLDDDACLVDAESVHRAVSLIDRNPQVAAVACALAEADGSPWPASMQPSPVGYVAYVPSYIGFAHVLRRGLFLKLGGYRESFYFYGEEKDYCLRLLNAGYDVVYHPGALVAHIVDPEGRSSARYLRYTSRNDCLNSLYNEPLPMPFVTVPVRLIRYLKMKRHGRVQDPGGFAWIVRELVRALPSIVEERKPVTWASVRRWRQLRRLSPAYDHRAAA